jgi:hypothetical protein
MDHINSTETVIESVFFDILSLLKVKLKEADVRLLKKLYGKGDRIDYRLALAALTINMDSLTPF